MASILTIWEIIYNTNKTIQSQRPKHTLDTLNKHTQKRGEFTNSVIYKRLNPNYITEILYLHNRFSDVLKSIPNRYYSYRIGFGISNVTNAICNSRITLKECIVPNIFNSNYLDVRMQCTKIQQIILTIFFFFTLRRM